MHPMAMSKRLTNAVVVYIIKVMRKNNEEIFVIQSR